MNFWMRSILLNVASSCFTSLFVFSTPVTAQSDPCTESTGVRVLKNTTGGALMGAVIGAVVGGGKGAVIGAGTGGGITAVASIHRPGNCKDRSRSIESRRRDPKPEPRIDMRPNAPSFNGLPVVICMRQGQQCSPAQQGVEELIESGALQAFSRLGGDIQMAAGSTNWQPPCERIPGPVICVKYGSQVSAGMVSVGQNGNGNVNISHFSFGGGEGGYTQVQRSLATVSVELYTNSDADSNGRMRVISIRPLATSFGESNSVNSSGQRFMNAMLSGEGGSMYGSYGTQRGIMDDYQLARLGAVGEATMKLYYGNGWLPQARQLLSSNNSIAQ